MTCLLVRLAFPVTQNEQMTRLLLRVAWPVSPNDQMTCLLVRLEFPVAHNEQVTCLVVRLAFPVTTNQGQVLWKIINHNGNGDGHLVMLPWQVWRFQKDRGWNCQKKKNKRTNNDLHKTENKRSINTNPLKWGMQWGAPEGWALPVTSSIFCYNELSGSLATILTSNNILQFWSNSQNEKWRIDYNQ